VIPDASLLEGQWVRIASVVEPDPAASAAYQPIFESFRALYAETRDTVHALARSAET
jgi:xylulokinase